MPLKIQWLGQQKKRSISRRFSIQRTENPFSADPEKEIGYNRDQGCLVAVETETPRNIFSYVRRTNRRVRNSLMKNSFDLEKANAQELSK